MNRVYIGFCLLVCLAFTGVNMVGWAPFEAKAAWTPAGPRSGLGGRSAHHVFFHK